MIKQTGRQWQQRGAIIFRLDSRDRRAIGLAQIPGRLLKIPCFSMERLYKDRNLRIDRSEVEGCWFRGEAQGSEEMLATRWTTPAMGAVR